MPVKFYGYATIFGEMSTSEKGRGKLYLPGCYDQWLHNNTIDQIPMLRNHSASNKPIGRWLHAKADGIGLFVVGELYEDKLPKLHNGLSTNITATDANMAVGWDDGTGNIMIYKTSEGGMYIFKVNELSEISIVDQASYPGCKILGRWPIF